MKTNGPVQVGPNSWEQTATFKSERQMRSWVERMGKSGWTVKTSSAGGLGVGRLKDFVVTMAFVAPQASDTAESFRIWATAQIMQLSATVSQLQDEVAALRSPANVVNITPGVAYTGSWPTVSDPWAAGVVSG